MWADFVLREFVASCTIPLLGAAAVDYDMQQHLQWDSVWRWSVATLRSFRLATWDPMHLNSPRVSKVSRSKILVMISWIAKFTLKACGSSIVFPHGGANVTIQIWWTKLRMTTFQAGWNEISVSWIVRNNFPQHNWSTLKNTWNWHVWQQYGLELVKNSFRSERCHRFPTSWVNRSKALKPWSQRVWQQCGLELMNTQPSNERNNPFPTW